MKILIFNWRDITHPQSGGAEIYLHEMAKRWVKEAHTVGWLCGYYPKGEKEEVIDGIYIIRRGEKYTVYLAVAIYYLLRLRGKYDVIIDGENGIPFFTPLYTSIPKVLLIHHIHREVFFKELKFPLSWIGWFLESKLMPLIYRRVRCLTVSQSSKVEIERLKLGNISIVFNGIDLNTYIPGEKSSFPLITYLGRLKAYKSLPILIEAMKRVIKEISEARLAIVGSGSERESLEILTQELNLTSSIKFYGHIEEKEKVKILQKSWIFINPSLKEGWGVTTIEANACGTPVIASNVPGLRDSVIDGKTGYLFKYGDVADLANKIIRVLKDGNLREKLAQNALSWSKNFSWDKSASETLRILKGILSR